METHQIKEKLIQTEKDKREDKYSKNTYSEASFLSKLFFCWIIKSIKIAKRKQIDPDDLGSYDEEYSADKFSQEILEYWNKNKSLSLFKLILYYNKWTLILLLVVSLVNTLLSTLNIFIIEQIIMSFSSEKSEYKLEYLIITFIFSSLLSIVLSRHTVIVEKLLSFKAGIQLTSLIFNKILTTKPSGTISRAEEGEIINFIQIDANKLIQTFASSPYLIIAPLKIVICVYLLFKFYGWSYAIGLGFLLLMLGISYFVVSKQMTWNIKYLANKDERMKLTNQVFENLKFLKFYSWDSEFKSKIIDKRGIEMHSFSNLMKYQLFNIFLFWTSPVVTAVSTIGSYYFFNGNLNPKIIYTGMSIFSAIQVPIRVMPMSINALIDLTISLKRIEVFLKQPNKNEFNLNDLAYNDCENAIVLKKSSFTWGIKNNKNSINDDTPKEILSNIEFKIKKNELVAIIGEVGSGKSSLIRALLNDLCFYDSQNKIINESFELKDVLEINGSVAYTSQSAWIQNSTVRDNILFFKDFDALLYNKVIKLCELEEDLKILKAGDMTEIGEKGINLSGGQKARVSLARAVYSNKDIYLFDDPLSALDGHVGEKIFTNLIKSNLENKTRILITNNINLLQNFDRIILMKEGSIKFDGSYNEILHNAYFTDFINSFKLNRDKAENPLEEIEIKNECISDMNTTVNSNDIDKIIVDEDREQGKVNISVYFSYLKYIGGSWVIILAVLSTLLFQSLRIGSDFWMKIWMTNPVFVNDENLNYYIYGLIFLSSNIFIYLRLVILAKGSIKASTKLHDDMVDCLVSAPINLYHDTEPKGRMMNRLSKDIENLSDLNFYIGSFIVSSASCLGVIFLCSYYNQLALISIPFIGTIGYILVRNYIHPSREIMRLQGITRSKMLNTIREAIPGVPVILTNNKEKVYSSYLNKTQSELNLIEIFSAGLDSWLGFYMDLVGWVFLIGVFACVYFFQDKFSDITVGQILTYLTFLLDEFSFVLFQASSVENSMVSVERCLTYTNIPSEFQVFQVDNNSTDKVSKLDSSYVNSSKIDNSDLSIDPSAIERINAINDPNSLLSSNNNSFIKGKKLSSHDWLLNGSINFINFSVKYRPNTDLVLKNINLKINAGEKVGIVGRTGSGKSTLSLCLFRILEAFEGKITIDNMDISTIPLNNLRKSITIIPQDSVIFKGTLKFNLDPLEESTDSELFKVCNDIGLWDILKVKDLSYDISNECLSAGEKQLVSIARAILRKSKIVMIDEATSSIDTVTEDKIQIAFNTFLKDSTLLAIAHRIKTVINYDKIIVLDNGNIAEVGSPGELLLNKDGIFYSLYNKSLAN